MIRAALQLRHLSLCRYLHGRNLTDIIKKKHQGVKNHAVSPISPLFHLPEGKKVAGCAGYHLYGAPYQEQNPTYEEFSGRKGYCEAIGGGTYVHHIPGGVAYGAGEHDFPSYLHGPNERARISQLLLTAEIYAAVIARICGE